jgi:large subunit ribosomal protein L29
MKNRIDLTKLSVQQLQEAVKSIEQRIIRLKFEHAITPVADTAQFGKLKKEVAQLKTELHQRSLALAKEKLAQYPEVPNYREILNTTKFPTPVGLATLKKLAHQNAK